MEIVDAQLHEPGPVLLWTTVDPELREQLLQEILEQIMDAVGVTAVVLHPVEDPEFVQRLCHSDPERFASVPMLVAQYADKPVGIVSNADAPDIADRLLEVYERPGVVAVRIAPHPYFNEVEFEALKAGGYDRAFAACETHGIPIMLLLSGAMERVDQIARRFPSLQIILDHMGLMQPPNLPHDPDPTLALEHVLRLAAYPNVALKLSGAPSLSREGYPFADVWPTVLRLLEAFGVNRVLWGSDIGRFRGRVGWTIRLPRALRPYAGKHDYLESLAFILFNDELNAHEKERLLGRTARELLKWPAQSTPVSTAAADVD